MVQKQINLCSPYISAPEHQLSKYFVSTPHNTPLIMGDRHKNIKDLMLSSCDIIWFDLLGFVLLITILNGYGILQGFCKIPILFDYAQNIFNSSTHYFILLHILIFSIDKNIRICTSGRTNCIVMSDHYNAQKYGNNTCGCNV